MLSFPITAIVCGSKINYIYIYMHVYLHTYMYILSWRIWKQKTTHVFNLLVWFSGHSSSTQGLLLAIQSEIESGSGDHKGCWWLNLSLSWVSCVQSRSSITVLPLWPLNTYLNNILGAPGFLIPGEQSPKKTPAKKKALKYTVHRLVSAHKDRN